jgi:hypothetical protein
VESEKPASSPDIKRPKYGSLDCRLKLSVSRAIRSKRVRRRDLAAELTRLLGRAVSPAMVDTWTANSKFDWHIPADAVPALAEILQDESIQRQLLSPTQLRALRVGESARRLRALLREALADCRKLAKKRTRRRAR